MINWCFWAFASHSSFCSAVCVVRNKWGEKLRVMTVTRLVFLVRGQIPPENTLLDYANTHYQSPVNTKDLRMDLFALFLALD